MSKPLWYSRAVEAARLISLLPLEPGATVVDLGCGQQTLRSLLAREVIYKPVDRIRYSDDTMVVDLNGPGPDGQYDVAVMLGLLEYLQEPLGRFDWIAGHARYAVFSYVDESHKKNRSRRSWQGCRDFDTVENYIKDLGGAFLHKSSMTVEQRSTRMYSLDFSDPLSHRRTR